MKVSASVQLLGDYGSKSGLSKLLLPDMPVEAYTSTQSKAQAFAAAIVAANLTGCSVGDVSSIQKSESLGERPDADINIKERVYYAWRTALDSKIHRGTIPGVPKDADIWVQTSTGDELNDVAKTALGAALAACYGVTEPDSVIVLWGRNKE